jgi:hypothetical protein
VLTYLFIYIYIHVNRMFFFLGELGVLIELDAIVELFGVIGRVKYVLEGKLMPYIMMFDRISVIITAQRSE